jgi:hypothetical protein
MTQPRKPTITDPDTWYMPAAWSEDDLAMAVATRLRQMERDHPFTFAHDQNAARRSRTGGAKAKAMGMRPGEPDVRVYLPQSRIGHIELKATSGTVSDAQRQRHHDLRALGHDVRVLKADTPGVAADQAEAIVMEWLDKEAMN